MTKLTKPIKYPGGKDYLIKEFRKYEPPHTHFVEAYCGGCSYLLQKPYEGYSEVINDINKNLINFWAVLQLPVAFEQFQRIVSCIPFAQDEFEAHKAILDYCPNNFDNFAIVNQAISFFVVARQSYSGAMKSFAPLTRNRTRRGMNEQAAAWLGAVEGLPEIHARLKRVVILNKPALEVIQSQDGPNTFQYLDPPYLHETRNSKELYTYEMSEIDHDALLDTIVDCKSKIMLSGYQSVLYKQKLSNWNKVEFKIDNKMSKSAKKEIKTECIWMNY